MSVVSLIALLIFLGYTLYARMHGFPQSAPPPQGQVMSDNASASATLASSPQLKLPSHPSPSSENAHISISVDSKQANDQITPEIIVYPGATAIKDRIYETGDSGESVYSWYKEELEKRSYQIRNNIKTRANDKFKAILQGVSKSTSIKVTINQETASAKTQIILE